MYKIVKSVSAETLKNLEEVISVAKWKEVKGSGANFQTSFFSGKIKEFPKYKQAFFLKISPGGAVHRHTDTPREEKTYHIPIYTNPQCKNNMYPGGEFHLEVGSIYWVDRLVEHDSVNNGETDRIHLLVEV